MTPCSSSVAACLPVILLLVGCTALSSQPDPSTAEGKASDVAASVAEAFHAAGLDGWQDIQIDVRDGIVVLRGTDVPAETMTRAATIAKDVDGVRQVLVTS